MRKREGEERSSGREGEREKREAKRHAIGKGEKGKKSERKGRRDTEREKERMEDFVFQKFERERGRGSNKSHMKKKSIELHNLKDKDNFYLSR